MVIIGKPVSAAKVRARRVVSGAGRLRWNALDQVGYCLALFRA
jgi:hypothetical protein